jgi:hypothetical protein
MSTSQLCPTCAASRTPNPPSSYSLDFKSGSYYYNDPDSQSEDYEDYAAPFDAANSILPVSMVVGGILAAIYVIATR